MTREKNPKADDVPAAGLAAGIPGLRAALERACDALERARRDGAVLPPAAGAILDGTALIDAQLRQARGQLLHDHGRLPLAEAGGARILALARSLAAREDGRIERPGLAHFLAAPPTGAALCLAELRLFPAALRLALFDTLREVAERASASCAERRLAAGWADRMLDTAACRSGDLVLLVADMARQVTPLGSSFVAELARRLQGQGGAVAQALAWIDARLLDEGSSIGQQVQRERDTLAADGALAENLLASLRLLGVLDWRALAEQAGAVDALLRADPDGSYPRMDGPTRDRYRLAVETLARSSGRSEETVAQEALALAGVHRVPGEGGLDTRRRHIGYYLAGPGLASLEARLQPAPGPVARLRRALRAQPGTVPLALEAGATALLTLLFAASVVLCARREGAGLLLQVAVALLALPGTSGLARALADMMAAWLAPPLPMPRMDFSAGIPADAQTLVAVSARLANAGQVDALCRDLEVRYLANRDPGLRFCLLADLHDAPSETMPEDAALVAHAVAAIDALNQRYARKHDFTTIDEDGHPATELRRVEPFLLLQRPRAWSEGEQAWIGRGRRRGQLADLNAFLAGAAREGFATAAGSTAGLAEMRYVIALDAATDLPRDTARRLAGAMAHPLNQPVLDASGRQVAEGHALLRPDTGIALPGQQASRYQRLWSEARGSWAARLPGADGEERAMLGWAAIYDVDAADQVARAQLTHEALPAPGLVDEGCLHAARDCGVRLEEAAPASHGEHAVRRHRAVRAAWQVAGWVRRRLPAADAARAPNPMTAAARWQLFDSLRDSLAAPALVALLVLCWSTLAAPAFWTAVLLALLFLPALLGSLLALADRPHDAPWRQHLDSWVRGARVALVRAALATAFLPHAAWCQLDALVRALWRRYVSRRGQLEWRLPALARPAAVVRNNWLAMWFAPVLAVAIALLLTFANPYSLFSAAPVLLVWFLSPLLAWWTGLPLRSWPPRLPRLPPSRRAALERLARRNWRFFEDHAGPANNWLPPEGVQEHPHALADARSTPAGIAIYLLSALAARDFGFLPPGALLRRLDASLASLALLERWNGHFLAAYDNATLAPLEPARVLTRDSGWMALGMRLLAGGLDELPDCPIAGARDLDGLRAALQVVDELAQGQAPQVGTLVAAAWAALDPQRCRAADTLPGLWECLQQASAAAGALEDGLLQDAGPALRDWSACLAAQARTLCDELLALAPWMRASQEYVLDASLTRIPTLRELARLDTAPGAQHGLARLVRDGRQHAGRLLAECERLAVQARGLGAMDFGALLDPASGRLATGCDVREESLARTSCDLLASEERLASYLAVAQDQLAQQHWWALGRPMRVVGAEQLLLSHEGALSDYLAPQVLLPSWRDTLLDQAGRAAVRVQVAHGARLAMPWGFAESACHAVDAQLRYQDGRFGVPAAALARGASQDLAAAPYAVLLALPVAPGPALANLERMAQEGLCGNYGLFDAIDYGPARLPHGERRHVVRVVAARHQGLGLLALLQVLRGAPMQRRFLRDAELRAALPLLQEAPPASGATAIPLGTGAALHAGPAHGRRIDRAAQDAALAEVQLLSNGSYHLVLDSDGAGRSLWQGTALTRWEPDPLGARGGLACVLRDTGSGELWSATLAPLYGEPERYEAVFAEGRASFLREERGLEIASDAVVAPEDDAELRRIRIRNTGAAPRTLEATCHVVLAAATPHARVRVDGTSEALLCSFGPGAPVLCCAMRVRGAAGAPAYSSSCADPAGALPPLEEAPALAALAIRRSLVLAPGQEITLDLVLGAAATPAAARALAAGVAGPQAVEAAIEAAWNHGQAALQAAGLDQARAQRFNLLAGCLLAPRPGLRADAGILERNVGGRAALRALGLDPGRPLLVLQPGLDGGLAPEILQAHAYWRARGFEAELVLLCEHRAIRDTMLALAPEALDGAPGPHLFLLDELAQEDRILLLAAAGVLLLEERGSLADQLRRAAPVLPVLPPPFVPRTDAPAWMAPPAPVQEETLRGDDGAAGFSQDGREAVVRSGAALPAPWEHPLANPGFGALLPATGPGRSWYGQRAQAVSAPQGEAYYLRDEDSGAVWSPTPWPLPSGAPYRTRHGFGYTLFEHEAHGIASELRCFVAHEAPLKYAVLRLHNRSDAPRRLSVTGYVQWWLDGLEDGQLPPGPQVVSSIDVASGALLARHAFGTGFGDRVAFFHVDAPQPAYTADRREFVGRHRSLARPAALARKGLAGTLGAGRDPCAALQAQVALEPGASTELVFLLGVAGPDSLAASRAVQQHGGAKGAALALRQVHAYWDTLLGGLRLATPDPAFDLCANGWWRYAAVAGTLGGTPAAQLQGALAALPGSPDTLRATLLRAARADLGAAGAPAEDFLWLPWALQRYLGATGDYEVLREPAGGEPTSGTRLARDDLYQVCMHGLRGCLRFGARGLPLRGAVMHEDVAELDSRPEDLRLAFLLATALQRFAEVADRRADFGFATTCRGAALALAAQAEEHGWEGAAYALDGAAPEGATQAWAAIAGADPGRVDAALDATAGAGAAQAPHAPWLGLALAGRGVGTRAWQLARVRCAATPCLMMERENAIAAAWACVLLDEGLLGLRPGVGRLALAPLLPEDWDALRFRYRHGRSDYHVVVRRATVGEVLVLDGVPQPELGIELADDGREHQVELTVERRPGDARAAHGNNEQGTRT
ncbi:GH36-type glycosyl hydrolase domain-containing protein [Massilia sp. MS-15]|uniref:GH36-type glycosyl hydrolase domain-containing protein n=1 Tax=Massilia sp. MS-15 TaxID=2878200 RepID=UPI001CD807EE|nr:glucoamylase family protein [Massilia sp. MS-15]MCA1245650.1 hypothetical protein [Massilia sp. MS-15]